jgi:hypothetical protein
MMMRCIGMEAAWDLYSTSWSHGVLELGFLVIFNGQLDYQLEVEQVLNLLRTVIGVRSKRDVSSY